MCHLWLKHQINTVYTPAMDWSFAAPSAVSLPCKSNYVLMTPRLKIGENEAKRRNNTSLVSCEHRANYVTELMYVETIDLS